jgi:hypothetical protein
MIVYEKEANNPNSYKGNMEWFTTPSIDRVGTYGIATFYNNPFHLGNTLISILAMSNQHFYKCPEFLILEFSDLVFILPQCLFPFPIVLLFRSVFLVDKVLMPSILTEVGNPMCKHLVHFQL